MSQVSDDDLSRRTIAAIRALPKRQREIFLMHVVEGLSYAEMARRTSLSIRQVERHMARAIYKIDKQLDGRRLRWWERLF